MNSDVPTPLLNRDTMGVAMCRVDCAVRITASGAEIHTGAEGVEHLLHATAEGTESASTIRALTKLAHGVGAAAKLTLGWDAIQMVSCMAECKRKGSMCLVAK
jgi:hypothetical protein